MTFSLLASAALLALFIIGVETLAGDGPGGGSPAGVLGALFDRTSECGWPGASGGAESDSWSLAGRPARLDEAEADPEVEPAGRPIELRLQRVEARVQVRRGGRPERRAA